MKVEVSLDRIGFKRKPGSETAAISSRIGQQVTYSDVREIADKIGSRGHTFCPVVFKNGRRLSRNFDHVQLFVLDFDGSTTYEEIKTKAAQYGLPILFSYKTFSWTEQIQKFRVVFCHIVPVAEKGLADLMLNMLLKIFPEADRNCSDMARMFFGGKGLIELNEENVFRADELAKAFEEYVYCKNRNQFVRNMKRFAEAHHIGTLENGFLNCRTYQNGADVCTQKPAFLVEKTGSSIIYKIEIPEISTKIVFYKDDERKSLHRNDMCDDVLNDCNMPDDSGNTENYRTLEKMSDAKIRSVCRLYKEFISGINLPHGARFLLATNIRYISGCKKRFLKVIKKYYGSYNKWKYEFNRMKAHDYSPMGCDRGCPYADECSHTISLYMTLKGRRRIIRTNDAESYEPLNLCYGSLETALAEAMAAEDNAIHLIPGQTGLGKTQAYIDYLHNTGVSAVIAVPTVNLKREIAERLGDQAVEVMSLPELYMPDDLAGTVKSLYDRGLYKDVARELTEYMKKLPDGPEKQRYKQYLQPRDGKLEHARYIIITHARLLRMNEYEAAGLGFLNRVLIVDEDILFTLLRNIKSIPIQDLKTASENDIFPKQIKTEIQRILTMPQGSYRKIGWDEKTDADIYIAKKEQDDCGITGNLNELFHAGACCKDNGRIMYFVPSFLPKCKTIVLSATLNDRLYKRYFRDRKIVSYDIPKARYVGKLTQYTYYPMSRRNLAEVADKVKGEQALMRIMRGLAKDADYLISFKQYDELFGNNLHYGNALGIDRYKGKNIILVGTPHLNENSYKLAAVYMGVSMGREDTDMRLQKVRDGGYEFFLMSYKDNRLQEIQLYMIRTELEQCIGRARLLREPSNVYLFSNFPCEQAELIQDDYLEQYPDGGRPCDDADM